MAETHEYVVFSNACPDCGGTLEEYDEYSLCEFVDPFENTVFVGIVGCGWTEDDE